MKNTNYEKEETKNHSTSRLIPEGELKCVWMTAGLVAYKLCDQEYNCDFCSFNESFLGERNFQTIGDAIKNHEDRIKTVKLRSPVNNLDEFGIEKTLAERFLKGLFDFKIEKDFLYYEGHTWVKQNNGHVKIGIDDFLCKFMTKIKHIILPPESTLILQEHPCCWIAGEFGTVPVVSPLSGYIISLNQEVFENPELPIADPYGRGWLLRLKPLDFEKEAGKDDIIVEQHGVKLFIDKKSAGHLVGTTIDFVDSLQGSGFKIDNPNATSTCGCGNSFG